MKGNMGNTWKPNSFLAGSGVDAEGGGKHPFIALFLAQSSLQWAFYSIFIEAEAEASSRILSSHIKLLKGPELQTWNVI